MSQLILSVYEITIIKSERYFFTRKIPHTKPNSVLQMLVVFEHPGAEHSIVNIFGAWYFLCAQDMVTNSQDAAAERSLCQGAFQAA